MKVVFLDRDGVVNTYPGDKLYVTNVKEFKIISGSIEGIKKFNDKNFKIFIISNQAGVEKGLYTYKDLTRMNQRLLKELHRHKAFIDGIYYCTHSEETNCDCRKPKTGLVDDFIKENDETADWENSIMVGDRDSDKQFAKNIGVKFIEMETNGDFNEIFKQL